ncbi:hypothetical protein NGM44_09510 [Moraxella sp. FZFQ2102]|uniref:hypothetical protein n=1 Tax=Moraxella sp. FZFQ2102 TaxID=2953752 RepID=UPI00209BF1D1|nr:hypothetical protein [Moraxella sp. FZFQ2102]USZ14584.1 hypothetical protein NGM44_09510 [Moraxella sp. FZFQ2102]
MNDTTNSKYDANEIGAECYEETFDAARLFDSFLISWQQTLGNIKHNYATAADSYIDEVLLTASEQQINDALYRFVTRNVKMLHDVHLDLHDGWLRLYCTVDFHGIFASVASNFELVNLQLDRHHQRLILRQISDTDVIELHTRQWYKAPLAKFAVASYRAIMRKDPLPFILSSIKIKGVPFTEHKDDVIYLDIGRWLKADHKDKLRQAQVNHATLKNEQLLLKLQPNFTEIFSFGDPNADIITAKDNPNKADKKAD